VPALKAIDEIYPFACREVAELIAELTSPS